MLGYNNRQERCNLHLKGHPLANPSSVKSKSMVTRQYKTIIDDIPAYAVPRDVLVADKKGSSS